MKKIGAIVASVIVVLGIGAAVYWHQLEARNPQHWRGVVLHHRRIFQR